MTVVAQVNGFSMRRRVGESITRRPTLIFTSDWRDQGRVTKLKLLALPHRPDLPLPSYATAEAAGLDLASAVSTTIASGQWQAVGTGLAIELPAGFEAQVRPRSGLALKHGVTVLNAPGTIDADYRGEIKVLLINHGPEAFTIRVGDRIGQLVVAPVTRVEVEGAASLSETGRGEGGFGHTGR